MSRPLAPSTSLMAVWAATTPSSPGLNSVTEVKCRESRSVIGVVMCRVRPARVTCQVDRDGGSIRAADQASAAAATSPARKVYLLAPLVAVLALVPVAVFAHSPMDFELAYRAGQQAWTSGHPERIATWSGTPFYAMVMAAISRAWPLDVAATGMLIVNLLARGGVLLGVWNRLHRR